MKIGMITIGQSPRNDIVQEMRDILGQVEIVERGCLDSLTREQIEGLKPKGKEHFLVTLLRDGSVVQVSKEKTIILLQQLIKELENEDIDLILMLCTGGFTNLKSKKIIIEPGKLLHKLVQGILSEEKRLGVIIPSSGQIEQAKKKWSNVNHVVVVASPFEKPEEIEEAAKTLDNVDLTVLDCMGYTRRMKEKVKEITAKPVILPRTIVSRIVRELLISTSTFSSFPK